MDTFGDRSKPYPPSVKHQNSWDLWMWLDVHPTKMYQVLTHSHFMISSWEKSTVSCVPNCQASGTPRGTWTWNSTLFLFWSISLKECNRTKIPAIGCMVPALNKVHSSLHKRNNIQSDALLVSLNVFCVTNLWKSWIPHKWFDSPLNMKYDKILSYIIHVSPKCPKHPVQTSSFFAVGLLHHQETSIVHHTNLEIIGFEKDLVSRCPKQSYQAPSFRSIYMHGLYLVAGSNHPHDTKNSACYPVWILLNLKLPSVLCSPKSFQHCSI